MASLTPYYEDASVTLYHGDCRDVMPSIDRADAVITDPPYNLRTEDIALEGRSAMKRDFGTWDEAWHPREMLTHAMRILPEGGSLLAFTSDRLLSAYRESEGWKPRGTLVWLKSNPAPHPRPAYVSATEWLVWLQKPGKAATWNANGYTLNVLQYGACAGLERTEHPTQKPEELMRELIGRHTQPGDLVLDPYAGSGTTLVAAKRLGRRAIGIELEQGYCDIAVQRLAQGSLADMFTEQSA